MLAKVPVEVRFAPTDQRTKKRFLLPGRLTLAQNVRQRKRFAYSKRYGYGSLDKTTDTGTISSGASMVAANAGLLFRSADAVYLRSVVQSKWLNRGYHKPVMPSRRLGIPSYGTKPCLVSENGRIWVFAADPSTGRYYYTVFEASTGAEIVPTTQVSSTQTTNGRAFYAGGAVWLAYSDGWGAGGASNVFVAKFNTASPSTAPTITTWVGAMAGNAFAWDVMVTSTDPVIMIGQNATVRTAYLDTATGGVRAAPGTVTTALGAANIYPVRWLMGSTSGTYYAALMQGTTLYIATVNVTTLVPTFTNIAVAASNQAAVSGYYTGADWVVFYTNAQHASPENATIVRYLRSGGVTTSVTWARAQYILSDPFQHDSTWYVLTGHDDSNSGGSPTVPNLQRGYVMRDATVTTQRIVGQVLYEEGGDVYQVANAAYVNPFEYGFVCGVSGSGDDIYVAVNGAIGSGSEFGTWFVTWDMAPSIAQPVAAMNGDVAVFPGGWASQVIAGAALRDLGLPMYPDDITLSNPAGTTPVAGDHSFAAVYAVRDRTGNVHRSAASPTKTVTISAGQAPRVVVPTCRMLNNSADVFIEIYGDNASGGALQLLKVIANDTTVDSVTWNYSQSGTIAGGETLYTTGGVLSNIRPGPFRAACTWRDRMFLFDTDVDGEVWTSKEFQAGKGPEFSKLLIMRLGGGTGRVYAGGAVDYNFCAFFKRDAIFLISGAGPTDRGSGMYSPQRLATTNGCTNPASVVTGRDGCYFQGVDGSIYLVTTGAQVVDVGDGMADNRSATITGAVHLPEAQEVRFWADSGKCLVLDYGNPTQEQPYGQWYEDTGLSAVSATVLDDVAHYLESDGTVRKEVASQFFDGTNTPILQKLKLAPVSFAGLFNEVQVDRCQFIGEFKSAHTLQVTMLHNSGASEVKNKVVAGSPEDFEWRPTMSGFGRCTSLEVTVEETGSGTGAGFEFEGLGFVVKPRNRMRHVNSTQRI